MLPLKTTWKSGVWATTYGLIGILETCHTGLGDVCYHQGPWYYPGPGCCQGPYLGPWLYSSQGLSQYLWLLLQPKAMSLPGTMLVPKGHAAAGTIQS